MIQLQCYWGQSHMKHLISLVMMPQKYVQNMYRNMTYSMSHDGNGITRKKLQYMINAVKVKSFCNVLLQYIYGVCIPHDKKEVLKLDEENSNDNWKEAIRLEIQELINYDTFIDKDLRNQMPNNYTKIRCHMTFIAKHDG